MRVWALLQQFRLFFSTSTTKIPELSYPHRRHPRSRNICANPNNFEKIPENLHHNFLWVESDVCQILHGECSFSRTKKPIKFVTKQNCWIRWPFCQKFPRELFQIRNKHSRESYISPNGLLQALWIIMALQNFQLSLNDPKIKLRAVQKWTKYETHNILQYVYNVIKHSTVHLI